MALEFTKLSEVATAESTTGSAKLLVEDGGEVKRLPVLAREMLPKGYPWDGRTVIEWDGNTEGREVLEIPQTNPLYKVSDVVLTATDLMADGATLAFSSGNTTDLSPFTVEEDAGVTFVLLSTVYVVVSGTAEAFAAVGMDLPSGTYFGKDIGMHGYLASLTYGTTTPISESLLPNGGVVSWNDLADRPFGAEICETLVDKTFEGFTENEDRYGTKLDEPVGLVVGQAYEVVFDGVSYILAAEDASESLGVLGAILGDLTFASCPFIIMEIPSVDVRQIVTSISGASHDIRISKAEITKLNELYLPSAFGGGENILYTNNEDSYLYLDKACTTKATFEDIRPSVASPNTHGLIVRCMYDGTMWIGDLIPIRITWDDGSVNAGSDKIVVTVMENWLFTTNDISTVTYKNLFSAEYTPPETT